MKLTDEQKTECNKALTKEDINIKPGQGNKVYVSGTYIRGRLNEVFAIGNWSYTYELSSIKCTHKALQVTEVVGYMAKVVLNITNHGRDLNLYDIGTCQLITGDYNNEDKARKGAITDGLKRCAVNLGNTFGLNIVADAKRLGVK